MQFDFAEGDLVILNDPRHNYGPRIYKILKAPKNINNPRSLCTIKFILDFKGLTRQWEDPEYPRERTLAVKYIARKPNNYMQHIKATYNINATYITRYHCIHHN